MIKPPTILYEPNTIWIGDLPREGFLERPNPNRDSGTGAHPGPPTVTTTMQYPAEGTDTGTGAHPGPPASVTTTQHPYGL